ncbi:galactose 1-dehydrogenase [Octadecabacter temperatus]|uniref:L-arabinose 1-dehydrogenase n=1 Tax=Octadecabacter temperatus TaxID=1458307 RepID=A0A0K0YA17_9RHOB|nr:Gfo/Idh/MocA family oxidoreductase [Octadecabacter temperatus]AKS47775.1 L-arabinose 1-dehydrogenase [Octadecabacter temperatus]SIO38637.1 galactose 1-dehydrogenase [Octadecabacter temperatus]
MKIALVGIGKIAVDQHVPSIAASDDWVIAATVSRAGTVDGVPAFADLDTMLAENPDVEVVSLCLPPVPRFEYAAACLRAGRHVMLEKPPGATLAEVYALEAIAKKAGVTLFATWHSRMAKGVQAAKAALADKTVATGHVDWKENVRQWHPNQDWVFEPGGMGVLDPGINALSIMTEVLPSAVHLKSAVLQTPENRQTPIRAEMEFTNNVTASFDWLQEGSQTWEQKFTTTDGTIVHLSEGGNRCVVDGHEQEVNELGEYPALYARMAELVKNGQSDVDLSPMVHVSDIMTLAQRQIAPAFDW